MYDIQQSYISRINEAGREYFQQAILSSPQEHVRCLIVDHIGIGESINDRAGKLFETVISELGAHSAETLAKNGLVHVVMTDALASLVPRVMEEEFECGSGFQKYARQHLFYTLIEKGIVKAQEIKEAAQVGSISSL